MKGLILCAGRGTRLQPSTYTKPKCMLPVNGEYILVSIIKRLIAVGINEIGIVVSPLQNEIQETIGTGERWNASITYLQQKEAKGLADAVKCARSFVADSPFLLMLGDNVYEGELLPLIQSLENRKAAASILLQQVKDPRQFGVAVVREGRIIHLEEKPSAPQSDLAIIGVYALTAAIWPAIDQLKPSARGEYEMTDAIQRLITGDKHVAYSITSARFFDVGTHERWLEANRYTMDQDPDNLTRPAHLDTTVQCIPPVRVDPTARVTNSVIGPYVYVGPNSIVEHSILKDSILIEQVELSHIHAEGSVFGSRVRLQEETTQENPARHILGDQTTITRSPSNVKEGSK